MNVRNEDSNKKNKTMRIDDSMYRWQFWYENESESNSSHSTINHIHSFPFIAYIGIEIESPVNEG